MIDLNTFSFYSALFLTATISLSFCLGYYMGRYEERTDEDFSIHHFLFDRSKKDLIVKSKK